MGGLLPESGGPLCGWPLCGCSLSVKELRVSPASAMRGQRPSVCEWVSTEGSASMGGRGVKDCRVVEL